MTEYRVNFLAEPDEDGLFIDPPPVPVSLELPEDASFDVVLESALEFVGVYDTKGYSLEPHSDGGFVVWDPEGEALLGLAPEVEDAAYGEVDDEAYSPYVAEDGFQEDM